MKRLGFILIMMLAVVALLVAGCGGGDGEEATPTATESPGATATQPPTETETPGATATETPAPTQPSGVLGDLLGRTSEIESVHFTMVMTAPGLPEGMTSEVWQKTGKTKTQTSVMEQTVITYTDYDAQKMCTCFEATGCMGMDFSQAPPDPVEQSGMIEQYHPTILGSETVNGKDCLVFEWTVEGAHSKWWVDKDSGWPVRVETTTPQGTIVIEYTDVEFVDIPDNEFVFPAECG